MPSPRWSECAEPPIAAAIAAAVHAAWQAPEDDRLPAFQGALRKAVGPERYEEIEAAAARIFFLQRERPEGLEVPPGWAWFALCPGCRRLRRTAHTVPQNGRPKLQVLRDSDWLRARFEHGLSAARVARRLGCSAANVTRWADVHGLRTPRARRSEELESGVRRLYAAGEGVGKTARELGTSVQTVRDVLKRLGLATNKAGHNHHDREWWRERLEGRGYTKAACAREAGIRPHAANYYLAKFNLGHLVDSQRRRPPKYPELHDRGSLRRLLEEHGTYQAVAEEVGCAPTLVSRQARDLLGLPKRWKPVPHGRKSWWEERLEAGRTTWEMAEEAGIKEKSAREKLRALGLLTEAYRNNTRRERARRNEGERPP